MDLHEPAVRWGIGLTGAIGIAVIAVLFLEGTTRLLALMIAVIDGVVTPLILKQAAEQEDGDKTEQLG